MNKTQFSVIYKQNIIRLYKSIVKRNTIKIYANFITERNIVQRYFTFGNSHNYSKFMIFNRLRRKCMTEMREI